ncbi:kinesin-domain-containing protein [Aureobasidium pullulans]|uniref:Kinesin-domain-containing protein n=1 Tax=Aureobasidium pullulans TaxID=5580 RepID=A0A4S9X947_AURPU|nr:kinesin-domain-containing protein [Aureobasidium pullulans]
MSVRVVARIRPLLKQELEKDTIVEAAPSATEPLATPSIVRIPNPKNEAEAFSFQFNSVYDQQATQQQVFDNEIAPTVKHLFKGFDVTIFAYGVTGTGKTHTMRGGKLLAERGVIPRLLSSIYRRSRKIEKDTEGNTNIDVSMSYYEIYNDRVFDLFEGPEKRTPAGLPIRDNNGKTVVVGLTERPCTSLKDFETLYDQANVNRSTSATKLNAHSSRSHAVLCVKVTQVTGNEVRVSTASAIDLAGSEDNRRTDNGKERMVESASINKSLFVLAQCVEAISKKQNRIPYRESKMTRILSLGQNNGLTVMILNLAPVRSYHLDTLSSLNFANRTKKIEVNEVENRPFFRTAPKAESKSGTTQIPLANRQPLRPKALSHNVVPSKEQPDKVEKPVKAFSVYSDKPKPTIARPGHLSGQGHPRMAEAQKRTSSEAVPTINRPAKLLKPSIAKSEAAMSQKSIEELIEKKVAEKLAEQALSMKLPPGTTEQTISPDVQARLIALERRVVDQESARAEGLRYLLMAKQHTVRGEDVSALCMYRLALPHFPDNAKLAQKMLKLQEKIARKEEERRPKSSGGVPVSEEAAEDLRTRKYRSQEDDEEYQDEGHEEGENDEDVFDQRTAKPRRPVIRRNLSVFRDDAAPAAQHHAESDSEDELAHSLMHTGPDQTPRSKHILRIINSKDVAQIRLLKGVGAKKAEMIVNALCEMDDEVRHVGELGRLKGVGVKGVERMREGLVGVVA